MKLCAVCFALVVAATAPVGLSQQLILTNPLAVDRTPEVIEVPLQQVLAHLHLAASQAALLEATDAMSSQSIPVQLYSEHSSSPPEKILLLVQLHAHGEERISFHTNAVATKPTALVFGREAPERKDDFAWENQQVAYRIYGPALQATGEITSGIDVWSKRVPNFVIDSFYKRDLEGTRTHNPELSYHLDNGQGLDSYLVGPSRGCGGTAVFAGGQLYVSKNYTQMRMLSDGPIRFSFEVTYAPWQAQGVAVSETKRITLDAGTHLNKIESTYSFVGAKQLDIAAGLAIHDGADVDFPMPGTIAAVWDTPQIPTAGRIATGLISDPRQQARTQEAAGHALMIFTRHSGQPFTYFAGSGWSKADMPAASDWNAYLKLQLDLIEHPIALRWSR